MNNTGYIIVRAVWFCFMAAVVCVCLLVCGIAAWSCGASMAEVRENTQDGFLRFVEGWRL